MKAWQMHELGDPWDVLRLDEVDAPGAAPGMVVVAVEAADLNFADILQCQGSYQVQMPTPFTPGMSGGGTIIAVGDDVDLAIGQRVLGMTSATSGWFGEQAVLAAKDVTVIPDGVETTTAVAMHVTYGTSWFALHRRGNLQAG